MRFWSETQKIISYKVIVSKEEIVYSRLSIVTIYILLQIQEIALYKSGKIV